ncbi:MAG: ABC transporter permease subunit [Puniceicoccaceae bacterium]|nr:MAG: ABC transporter permease subunit [Puniceicoccaceae bacterium]
MKAFFRNPLTVIGCLLFGGLVGLALAAPWLPLADPNAADLRNRLAPPGSENHLLGTDTLGRDILSRLVWGTRVSLAVAAAATLVAAVIGSLIGLLAGFFRRWIDTLLMRGVDMVLAFPYLILALAIVAVLGPGLLNALIAIAIVNIPFFARTVRGTTVSIARMPFVEAARLGAQPRRRILFAEVLPNVLPVIIIAMSTTLGWMILETAGLSFLGLGAQPPQADLGSMLADGRRVMLVHPHVGLLPGVAILILVIGINLIGDGLRDWLDPRLEGGAQSAPGAATAVTAKTAAAGEPEPEEAAPVLEVKDLRVEFGEGRKPVVAVDGVGFSLRPGECLGLVGESGSGKSVTAMSLARLVASPPGRITRGAISIDGVDTLRASNEAIRRLRGAAIAYVFQNPFDSLHPLIPVGRQIDHTLATHTTLNSGERHKRILDLLDRVALPDPKATARALPHQLSGGQCQRVAIAMALANNPKILVADEPTTALDVTVQKRVLDLLARIREEHGLALLFISHDLGVVRAVADRIMVLRWGRVMEEGDATKLIRSPKNPYTRKLLESSPRLGKGPKQDLGLSRPEIDPV